MQIFGLQSNRVARWEESQSLLRLNLAWTQTVFEDLKTISRFSTMNFKYDMVESEKNLLGWKTIPF